ncbi:Phosphate-selective porin [Anaerohalosphaera lusitana]|uniref:Phosphate-selective porin n=1 Tax=Anaerohalosphaera lusitana TaxID=1936003 RepID=A0A1U9NIQ2_9BACT|nr:porin [Anaerohalosphaera lusitana]AQT67386.1 Phosphate-selective porin [Anaerohalosphaera lusitana]
MVCFVNKLYLVAVTGLVLFAGGVSAEQGDSDISAKLERMEAEIAELKSRLAQKDESDAEQESDISLLSQKLDEVSAGDAPFYGSAFENWSFGGYGDVHANFNEGDGSDQFDFHRLVLYLGYDFSDWIKFHSEWELEHAYVSDDSGGEFLIEQAYFDFLLSNEFNVRAGRVLTPLGILNKWHEPTLFNGVERPSFAKYIIPTTWSSDGIGAFGRLSPEWSYEAYVVGGLDGSKFDDVKGIRGGRIKERPSLHEPAFTGRVDYRPVAGFGGGDLRLGVSGYAGGLDNGNKGSNPGIDGDIRIASADFEWSVSKFDFTGAVAHTSIDGAREIGNGTAEEMFGWYLEAGYHIWPEHWKKGKFAKTDMIVFARYDDYDTQYQMPFGVAANPAGDRNEITLGVSWKLTPDFVVKADYQIREDDSDEDLNDGINLGIGFTF